MNHIGLFEGLGGFSIAASWMNWETIAWCEKDSFCRKILSYHFPSADKLGDIYYEDFTKYKGRCNVLTGGFPCQPFSIAGSRAGTNDDRYLWDEMFRAITEISPNWVVAENVRGLLSIEQGTVFEKVCTDLESIGYEVLPFIIPAAGVNAPHKRDRLWIIAHRSNARSKNMQEGSKQICETGIVTYSHNNRPGNWKDKQESIEKCETTPDLSKKSIIELTTDTNSSQFQRSKQRRSLKKKRTIQEESRRFGKSVCTNWENFPTQSPICGGNDGFSSQLDGITFPKWRRESIKGFGNAIVPNIALELFKVIELINNNLKK